MKSTQRAIRVLEPYRVELLDIGIPEPYDTQVLVKVQASSICSMHELKVYKGLYKKSMWRGYPAGIGVPGHEGAGIIVKTGKNISDFKIGDRVAMTGLGGGGVHAQYVLRDPEFIVRFGEHLEYDQAAPAELVGCLVNAFNHAGLLLGKNVAVSGLGAAGLLAVQLAKLNGAINVIGIDIVEERLKLGKDVGADEVCNPKSLDFKKLKKNRVDTVFDCSGNSDSIRNSFSIASRQVVLFGYTDEDLVIDQSVWFHSELTIKNAAVLGKNPMDTFSTAVRLLDLGKIDTKPLITNTMPLTRYKEALNILERKKAIKIVLHPWDEKGGE